MFGPGGWRWLLGLAVLTAGVAWGQEQAMPARLDPDGVQRLTLMGGNYHFQPDRIRVQVGVPVELEVYRTTRTPHLPSHRDRGMWGVLEVID